jgi:hypothetical protein
VPFYSCSTYGFFALDRHARVIAIVDPSPVCECAAYNYPYFYYLPRIQKVAKIFDRAMEEVDPVWNNDIYDWHPIFLTFIPKTFDE